MCAHRAAIRLAPNKLVASTLRGNLGALLMSGDRMQEALEHLDKCIAEASTLGEQAAANAAGLSSS